MLVPRIVAPVHVLVQTNKVTHEVKHKPPESAQSRSGGLTEMNGMPTTKPFYHNCIFTTSLKSPVPPSKSHYHTFQQVMSPTQASVTDDSDFPRPNGRNFVIWKTRVTAALKGKNFLGFVTQVDYARDFDFDFSYDEELNPALSDMRDMEAALDAAGAPKADDTEGPSLSESSSDASSETATSGDDGDVDMGQDLPP
ncbi:unnamed protein product [Phytophthora lilii]|uniref:Unnamed protein product n=1 Tax=Phytophthora lilii TaxID=2077276 RepID=A0A9W6X4G4_9STRA|nr:unnamed protein product [Phytophthora lilii]